jgi:hypothetical protein
VAGAGTGAATEARRALQRDLFRGNAEQQTLAYLNALSIRQEQLMEQKRAERMAELMASEAAAMLAVLAAVDETVRARLMPLVTEKLVVGARISILAAQLWDPRTRRPSVFIEPPLTDADRTAFRQEVEKLRQDSRAAGVSMAARLWFTRQNEEARLAALDAEIDKIMSEGGVALGNASGQLMQQRQREIEAELAKDRARFLDEQQALDRSLREAVRVALEKERETSRLAGVGGGGSGEDPVRIADLFGPSPAGTVGAEAAADRVKRQRILLQGFIEQNVADAVRDAAQARGIDVRVVRGTSGNDGGNGAKDRVDMTNDFASWIRVGGRPSVSVGGGRV